MSDEEHDDRDEEEPVDLDGPKLIDPRTLPARVHNLKAALVSGAHCLHSFQGEGGDTLARRLGNVAHAMLLGQPFEIWDVEAKASVTRREKALAAGKPEPKRTIAPRTGDVWRDFARKHAGKVIASPKEVVVARRLCSAIQACGPAARMLTTTGLRFEDTILWTQCGRARRSTPDVRKERHDANGRSFVLEIKTTRCAAPGPFGRDAKRLGYHMQLADQCAAIEASTGRAPDQAFIVAVETSPPHVVQVYEVPPTMLEQGAALCSAALEKLQLCEATGDWSGYSRRIEELTFPLDYGAAVVELAGPEDEEVGGR